MDLRPYQETALEQVLDFAAEHPKGRCLVVMYCRSGKTPTFAMAAKLMTIDQGLPGLWVAGSVEQLDQAKEHLLACGVPGEHVGISYGDRPPNPEALIQITTEATVDRRHKPPAEVVFWDEAHHGAAPRRRRIRKLYPDAFHLGFTATPERLTGMGLDQDYDHMIVPVQPSELIHDGHLAVPTVYAPEDKHLPKLKGVRVRGGDYAVDVLEKLVGHQAAIDKLVEEWARLGGGLPTVAFPVTVRHSQAIAARFVAAGIRAAHIDGDTPRDERKAIGAKLRSGEVKVASSCGVFNEGVNFPWLKCGVLARPTRSRALFIQQSSRCMTPYEGIRPRLLDMVGNHYHFRGYAWDDRAWSLARRTRSGEANVGGVKRCPMCSELVPRAAEACACGYAFGHAFGIVEVSAVPPPKALAELKMTPEQIAKKRAELEVFATGRGFKPGWVERVLAAMVGVPSQHKAAPEIAA